MASKHPVLPYRAGVGIVLVDPFANILILPGSEGQPMNSWRMPEGPLGMGESEREAALRVLLDQTGLRDVRVLSEAPGWFNYELPCDEQGVGLGGLYCGSSSGSPCRSPPPHALGAAATETRRPPHAG
jgi:putative (di)nucleoside polyphosphate hydrolase